MELPTSLGITVSAIVSCSTSSGVSCKRLIPFASTHTFCPAATSSANLAGELPVPRPAVTTTTPEYTITCVRERLVSRKKSVPIAVIVAWGVVTSKLLPDFRTFTTRLRRRPSVNSTRVSPVAGLCLTIFNSLSDPTLKIEPSCNSMRMRPDVLVLRLSLARTTSLIFELVRFRVAIETRPVILPTGSSKLELLSSANVGAERGDRRKQSNTAIERCNG